ncbi:MAG: hypothetical protein P4M05_22795 [Bradyrhizobium sp.]|nr:hypothetical protein [Bradyrhizobium sp.]
MLAVVENKQQPTSLQKGEETGQWIVRLSEYAENSSYRARNEIGVGDSTEINEIHGVVEFVEQGMGNRDGDGRLAHAARTHHTDQAPSGQERR